jgi:hypothetical protein
MLRAARLVTSPVNLRMKPCQAGRGTDAGYILRQIVLAEMKYGRCLRRADPPCK